MTAGSVSLSSVSERVAARKRWTPFFAWAAIVCLTATSLVAGGCDRGTSQEASERELLPDQEIDGFSLTQTADGRKLWTLSADHALIYEQADRVEMLKVHLDFFDRDGEVRSTMTSSQGNLLRRTNDMEALGNVVVTARDGTRLDTERLTWDERAGKIRSDRFVRVTKDKDVMTGVGLEADPDLTNVRVMSDFKAFVKTAEGELVEDE